MTFPLHEASSLHFSNRERGSSTQRSSTSMATGHERGHTHMGVWCVYVPEMSFPIRDLANATQRKNCSGYTVRCLQTVIRMVRQPLTLLCFAYNFGS